MISINFEIPLKELNKKDIKQLVLFVFKYLNLDSNPSISINICKSESVKEYNKKYRKQDSTTDVLSFRDEENNNHEILIDPLIVELNANEYKVSYKEELIRVIVHGVLHVLGFVHKSSLNNKENMFIVQEQIIKSYLENE